MSDTEKLINKQLLQKVHEAGLDKAASASGGGGSGSQDKAKQQHQQQLQQQLQGGCVRTASAAKRAVA